MKKYIPEDEFDDNEYTDRGSTLDLYNEELARKAVGGLFDEDDELDDYYEPDAKDDNFVTGFDRPPAKAERRETAYAQEPFDDLDYDDDGYDDDSYPPPKRDRSKESVPSPRPAIKVNVNIPASSVKPREPGRTRGHADGDAPRYADDDKPKRRPGGTSAAPSGRSSGTAKASGAKMTSAGRPHTPSYDEDEPIEDEYAEFRQRYRGRESVPSPRRSGPVRRSGSAESAGRPRTYPGGEYDSYEPEPSNMVRWVAAGLTFIFLLILAFLVYRINVISGELKNARAELNSTPTNEAQIIEMQLTIEQLEKQIAEKNSEIERLTNETGVSRPQPESDQVTSDADEPPVSNTTPATSAPAASDDSSALPTVYTVVSGDNLTKICKNFYGNTNPSNIEKIKTVNNLTNDNISVGQKLNIPK